jgi:xanthine dehydrogenase accessory factor
MKPRDEGDSKPKSPPPEPPFDVWGTIAHWRAQGRRFVLLTVVESRGFTPQKPGRHMLVADGGETAGTVGGGAIEHECVREAKELLKTGGATRMVKKQLTTELGMCCGGEMVVHLEMLEALPRLYVFGAGHVARPLASLAAATGFGVTVVDARPEWLNAERFPAAARELRDPEAAARELALDASDSVVVTTHDHALDQRVIQELLKRTLRFTGLIGSFAKQRKFALRLKARGFDDEAIARVRTPVGLSIGAQTPEEIAVSIVAELVAVRRGATPERGWVPPARVHSHAADETPQPGSSASESLSKGMPS